MAQTVSPHDWRTSGRTYLHRGQAVFYRDSLGSGSRVPLLLLHGFPTASWDWQRVWEPLAATQRLVAPDFIGFGFSAKPRDYAYSILDQADLVEELLAVLGIERVHLLAHDYGDTVAQELMARVLDRARRGIAGLRLETVCLLNGGLFPETHRPRPVQRLLAGPFGGLVGRLMNRRSFGRAFAAIFGPRTQPSAAELDSFWSLIECGGGRAVMSQLIGYMAERRAHRQRWVGALQHWQAPLRFINGPSDPVSGKHMLLRLLELVPGADIVELPGIGHYPQWEAPEALLTSYSSFRNTTPADADAAGGV